MNIDKVYLTTLGARAMAVLDSLNDLESTEAHVVIKLAESQLLALSERSLQDRQKQIDASMQLFSTLSGIPMPGAGDPSIFSDPAQVIKQLEPKSGNAIPIITAGVLGEPPISLPRRRIDGPQPAWMKEEAVKLAEDDE